MTILININGQLFPKEQAKISVLDRGFLYGDSVYEVVRTYSGKLFAIPEHLDRLKRSAESLQIPLSGRDQLVGEIRRTVEAAGNPESYCRIIVTRGSGPITLDPNTASNPTTLILVKPYEAFPEWTYQKGIKVFIPSVRRNLRAALDPAIKSGNYLNSVLALGEAKREGYDDALMLDVNGNITEASAANVFLAKDGKLLTPSLDTGILEGVTRGILLKLARDRGIPTEEGSFGVNDLEAADEVMLTSTLREVMPVVQVGRARIGSGLPGAMSVRLLGLFQAFVSEWLRSGA